VLGTSYRAETFAEHFGDGAAIGLEIEYVVEDSPLGTGGAIRNVAGRLRGTTAMVFNGDVPVANATADVTKGVEPLEVQFSSAGSNDPDEDPITFLWDFGDGTTGTDPNPVKTFTAKGVYTVRLTVSDGTGSASAQPIIIQVGLPPAPASPHWSARRIRATGGAPGGSARAGRARCTGR
jgi:PKD repeat protein